MRTMKTIQSPWRLLIAGGVLCAVWVLIAGADPASWVLGAPAVGLALAGIAILPPAAGPAPHWAALARLVGFFLLETVRGAVDVGARTLSREPVTRARVENWRTGLRTPTARLIACARNQSYPRHPDRPRGRRRSEGARPRRAHALE